MIKINDIKLNRFVIYCNNEYEYIGLMKLLNKNGYLWNSGQKIIKKGVISVCVPYPVYIFIYKGMDAKEPYITYGTIDGFNDYYKEFEEDGINCNTIFNCNDFLKEKNYD